MNAIELLDSALLNAQVQRDIDVRAAALGVAQTRLHDAREMVGNLWTEAIVHGGLEAYVVGYAAILRLADLSADYMRMEGRTALMQERAGRFA